MHRLGEIRDRGLENQSYRASGLTLLTAAISLWNTGYIERAIDSLRRKGIPINEQLITHLSPLGWEHINLSGDYVWRTNLKLGQGKYRASTYDKLSEIDQGAIVDNKRLGRALEMAQLVQAERDYNRSQSVPSGDGPSRRRKAPTTKKSQRSLDQDDMFNALVKLQSRSEEIFGKKPI